MTNLSVDARYSVGFYALGDDGRIGQVEAGVTTGVNLEFVACIVTAFDDGHGQTLQRELLDGEALLARHVDDKAERDGGFLGERKGDAVALDRAGLRAHSLTGNGLAGYVGRGGQACSIGYHEVGVAALAFEGFIVVGGEGVRTGGQGDGLVGCMVGQGGGETIPFGRTGEASILLRIYMDTRGDTAVDRGAGEFPHLDSHEAGRTIAVDALSGVVGEGLLVVGNRTEGDVLGGIARTKIEREDAAGESPGIAIRTEAVALAVVAVRGAILHAAAGLVEIVVEHKARVLGCGHIADGLVGRFADLVNAARYVPEAELVNATVEGHVGTTDGERGKCLVD